MAELTVDVGGRSYRLGCGEGEEEHLQGLAGMLDSEAQILKRQFGQMPEGRLLLMVGLIVADRLSDAMRKLERTELKLAEAREEMQRKADSGDLFGSAREEQVASRLNRLAAQIEGMLNGGGDGAT